MGPKPTPVYIKNSAFADRTADLKGGGKNEVLIGYSLHRGVNQKFTFVALETPKTYKICVNTSDSTTTWVTTHNPSAGDELGVGPNASVFTVKNIDGFWHISVKSAEDDRDLFWTLETENLADNITLERANNSPTQAWSFLDA